MNKTVKWLGNYWVSGAALIMLGFSIAINFGNFSSNDTSIILTFVGILATFIVVGNYAQVMAIKGEFKDETTKLNSILKEIETSQIETKKNLIESKGLHHYNKAMSFHIAQANSVALFEYANAFTFLNDCDGESDDTEGCLRNIESILSSKEISKSEFDKYLGNDKITELKKNCKKHELFEIFYKIDIAIKELV